MSIILQTIKADELPVLLELQRAAFRDLLSRYDDGDTNPGAETIGRIRARFTQPATTYYFIVHSGKRIGAIRLVRSEAGNSARISPMFIIPEYQKSGFGKEAVLLLERYCEGISIWSLDTILQERGLCRFYERLGYRDTGRRVHLRDGMDIIHYEKRTAGNGSVPADL